ncbi:MAG TPA: hypothetical protein VM756_13955 [Burkholderiales bacterium]|nr:hypothetical protein [Burkholderiales bacterium]
MQLKPEDPSKPYFVQTRPNEPQPSLKAARCLAGAEQHNGIRRSIPILQGGEVVDIKRY